MTKKLLLISNSTNPGEAYLGWCQDLIAQWYKQHQIQSAVFIPFAGVSLTWDDYAQKVKAVYAALGIDLRSIHEFSDPQSAIAQAQSIVVGGGNTWNLLSEIYRQDLLKAIQAKVQNGTPYMGWSAGSNLACPTIKTTNDMPIVEPESFNALGFIPFQINPHYLDAHPAGHGGETREDRIQEFIIANPEMYVAGLREACALTLDQGHLELVGRSKSLRVFKQGQEPKEYAMGADLQFLLN